MNGLQIKLQLDDNQPARWFDVETINFDDEVCFADGAGEYIEIEYQGEPLRIKSPSLTDDQQVVLDYLKSRYHDRAFPFDLVGGLNSRFFSGPDWETDEVLKAYGGLNSQEQFQVLAAFAEWGSAGD